MHREQYATTRLLGGIKDTTWPKEIWDLASKAWSIKVIHNFTDIFPELDHSLIIEDLYNYCSLSEERPLLKFHLLLALVENGEHIEFCSQELKELLNSECQFVRLISALLLEEMNIAHNSYIDLIDELRKLFESKEFLENMTSLSLEMIGFKGLHHIIIE